MVFKVVVEDERGRTLRELLDPQNHLGSLLPDLADISFQCLRFVDPYQDTTFNQRQMSALIDDLRLAGRRTRDKHQLEHLRAIEEMALEVQREAHRYLKFYGD